MFQPRRKVYGSAIDRYHSEKQQALCVLRYKALSSQHSGASGYGPFRVKHQSRRVSNDPTPNRTSEFKTTEFEHLTTPTVLSLG